MAETGEIIENKLRTEIEEEKTKPRRPKKKKQTEESESLSFFNSALQFLKNDKLHRIVGLFLLLLSVYTLIACFSYLFTWKYDQDKVTGPFNELMSPDLRVDNWLGKFGAITSHLLVHRGFGISSLLFSLLMFTFGFKLLFKKNILPIPKTIAHALFLLVFVSVACGFVFKDSWFVPGGIFGYRLSEWLTSTVGAVGNGLLLLFVCLSYLVITFNLSFINKPKDQDPLLNKDDLPTPNTVPVNELIKETPSQEVDLSETSSLTEEDAVLDNEITEELEAEEEETPQEEEATVLTDENGIELTIEKKEEETIDEKNIDLVKEFGEYDPTLDLSNYKFPPIDLLEEHGKKEIDVNADELNANKNKIVETLKNYNIEIEKVKATIGPTVTLYEIIPKAGTRIAKIKNLEDDIALSLSALGIRIIAPIPGKGTIGIEVPNQTPQVVAMRGMIASEKFQNSTMELPVALGKTISNETFIADLTKMPHLLMAGATGQGKSVGLNTILISLLYKKHPSQVKLVLVDPKKVELTLYNKIERHFLAKLPDAAEAIITDTKKVVHTLNSLCIEMDQRYELLKDAQVRTIKEYNHKFVNRKLNPNNGHRFMPYIVLVVDEFADLIMTAGKEVETPIARLAQLARAIGIHLIIATQRPSVNIITGTIKANFPARIAFRVTAKIDSRTILDSGGAEQLIGRGDMLLSTGSDLIRLQCAFVDTPEVENVCEFIGSQKGYPDAFLLPEYVDETAENNTGGIDPSERDALFEDAARVIVNHQQGSASLLQRKLKLGYNRAGRIIDQLESAGIIGPFEGSKAREVLIKDIVTLEQFLNNQGNNSDNS